MPLSRSSEPAIGEPAGTTGTADYSLSQTETLHSQLAAATSSR